jgi:hypothetical protein
MTDVSQFDPEEEQTELEVASDSSTAGTVEVRVTGLPFVDGYVFGELTITRKGTNVPVDLLQELLDSAKSNNTLLEVVSQ